MVWPRYELRLIDAHRRRCVATRYWTAVQLLDGDTVAFCGRATRRAARYTFVSMPQRRAPDTYY
jgi:hypothetical protein